MAHAASCATVRGVGFCDCTFAKPKQTHLISSGRERCDRCGLIVLCDQYFASDSIVWEQATDRCIIPAPGARVVAHDAVDHPSHYGGKNNPYEAIKIIEALKLDFCVGNALKYIARAGKKSGSDEVEDLAKAVWYLNRRIDQLKK